MRLAHLSDLHVFSLAGTSLWPFLSKRLPGLVNAVRRGRLQHQLALTEALVDDLNAQRPDEIVITGDLTSLSLDSEMAVTRRVLDRLEIGSAHVTIVPGNHDVYTLDALLRRPFFRQLGPYIHSDSGDDDFPIVRVRGPVAIVGLSTARPTPVPFASGALGARQRRRLEERLAELGRRGLFRVVLMHHPPVDNRVAVLRGLRDRAAVRAILRRVGAELVLHGHEHRDLVSTVRGPDGPIPIAGVGSASYDHPLLERRARYHLYEITPSHAGSRARIVSRQTRVHDPSSGSVVALPPGERDYFAGSEAYSNDQPPAPHTAFRG